MAIYVHLNIYDVEKILREFLEKKYNTEVIGITVTSWNQKVLEIKDGTMYVPMHHHIREDHSTELFK